MNNKRLAIIVMSVLAIIAEALPYGAVMRFAASPDEIIRETYPYFSLTPFGYANFGPFLTAVLTVVLLGVAIWYHLTESAAAKHILRCVSGAATLLSLLPLMFGLEYYSVLGGIITLLLLATTVSAYHKEL